MSAGIVLGALILAAPFVALFWWFAHEEGLHAALVGSALVLFVTLVIGAGAYLVTGGQS